MSAMPYSIVFLLPLTVVVGYLMGGYFTFLTPLWVFGIIPLLDIAFGVNKSNPSPEQEDELSRRLSFRLITWLTAPVQIGVLLWVAFVVTQTPMSILEIIGLTISAGLMGGAMGINVSHELVHQRNRFEKSLGTIMLLTVGYAHWGIEHVQGHHRHVGTPLDPATSRLGESFWRFFPRTVIGTFKSAWNIEKRRLERLGDGTSFLKNKIVGYLILEAALALGLWLAFGFGAVAFFIAQSIVAFGLLEAVNYLEHYGLERKKVGEDKYEIVTPLHSWNSSHWLTNYFLFHLQRHSDHHAQPQRRYQILRHFDESPQLPTGYAGMVLLALIPPLWRRVMDPRVREYRARTEKLVA